MSVVANRHDILILFDVANGNPNGDPDAGNMPRVDPITNRGLVSDVCLKRKIRNFVEAFSPKVNGDGNGFDILVRQGAIINDQIDKAVDEVAGESPAAELKKTSKNKEDNADQAKRSLSLLCKRFYDVRTFGAVLSTGRKVMKGSAHGQVRGPVQFTFASSFHPIAPIEVSITRCAVTKKEDANKERTMGNKHIIPYALYSAKAFVSPLFAERTGFTDEDLSLFFDALGHLFTHDHSAARGEMNVRAIYDFEHVGSQPPANKDQNAREAKLGCEHAHKLFAGVRVELKDQKMTYPTSFSDYQISDVWEDYAKGEHVVPGVHLHRRVQP